MKNRIPLTKEEVEDAFEYNDNQLWRKAWTNKNGVHYPRKLIENVAFDEHGYCRFRFKFRIVRYHVIVYLLTKGEIPDNMVIDHIDGNVLNNTPNNLRLVSNRQNQQNHKKHRDGKLPGATYRKKSNRWCSRAVVSGKIVNLGCFATELEAHQAYLNYIAQKKLA